METIIDIYLNAQLPDKNQEVEEQLVEARIESVEELCMLYQNKYGSFGHVNYYIYDNENAEMFIKMLNKLFIKNDMHTTIDAELLAEHIDQFTPMIVVDDKIVSRGVYPDLTTLRGGANSISRGGCGHNCSDNYH